MESKTAEDFLWGALIGSAIGAATALMLTPLSGEALRKKIKTGLPYPGTPVRSHIHARKRSINALAGEKRSEGQAKAHQKPGHQTQAKKAKPKHKERKDDA